MGDLLNALGSDRTLLSDSNDASFKAGDNLAIISASSGINILMSSNPVTGAFATTEFGVGDE